MELLRNRDAELAVIGLAMQDHACAVQLAALPDTMFVHQDTQAAQRAVFRCLQNGQLPDMITLSAEMARDIDRPEPMLIDCMQKGFAPSMYGQYLGILDDCRMRRLLKTQGAALITAAGDPACAADAAAAMAAEALRGSEIQTGSISAAEAVRELTKSLTESREGRCYTGIADLDRLTGGIRGGKLIVIGARPGVGKTALAIQMAEYVAQHCAPVLFVSLEMDGAEIMSRIAAAKSGVDVQCMESGNMTDDEAIAVGAIVPELSAIPLRISTRTNTPALIRKEAAAMQYRDGLGMIVIDYLQLLHASGKSSSRYDEISSISRDLKQLAMDLGVPVLALTQFNRQSEGGVNGKSEKRKPQMSEAKESGSIEQDANMFLTLWEPPEPFEDHSPAWWAKRTCEQLDWAMMALHVDKNRQGRTGCIYLGFDRPHMTFHCLDRREKA
ncbi:MAG: DnaB-like helicase C-terminal domain-containing protein [Clostridia bacterium]|nr:DnaB-like helicase C-terminal domain-containing protein [Clostridia bacterium]